MNAVFAAVLKTFEVEEEKENSLASNILPSSQQHNCFSSSTLPPAVAFNKKLLEVPYFLD